MEYQFEKNKLYAYLGKGLVSYFKRYNMIIAGGTITSLFTNSEINDIDVYVRSEEDALDFVEEIWDNRLFIVSNTKKALQFIYKDKNVQLIHFKYFNSPEEIFETFDYTVCMGAFDFKTEEFILHKDFLKHNSQRILKFNPSTAFPIVSMLRVQKYEGKKYNISKPEFIRVILTCMNLEVNTYEELKDQLGGMYGVNYDKLFEDIKDEEFSLEAAIDKIAGIALSEDYFKAPATVEFNDVDDILDSITKQPIPYIVLNDAPYRAFKHRIKPIDDIPANGKEISPEEYFKDIKIYKFVQPDLTSFHDRFFKYVVGEVAIAKGRKYSLPEPGLFFSTKDVTTSTYYYQDNKVLLEAEFNPLDVLEYDEGEVVVKKAKITRVVPEEEWKAWLEKEESISDGISKDDEILIDLMKGFK